MENFAKLFANNRAKVLLNNKDKIEVSKLTGKIRTIENSDLLEIKGVGQSTVETLLENGIWTIEELREAGVEKIRSFGLNPLSLKGLEKFLDNNIE